MKRLIIMLITTFSLLMVPVSTVLACDMSSINNTDTVVPVLYGDSVVDVLKPDNRLYNAILAEWLRDKFLYKPNNDGFKPRNDALKLSIQYAGVSVA